jgi:blue copper oxidase
VRDRRDDIGVSFRRLLVGASVACLAAVIAFVGAGAWLWASAAQDTLGRVHFLVPLRIPPLADSEVDAAGRRVFDLTVQQGTSRIVPEASTRTWGVNGPHLGPTLRAERYEDVLVRLHNELPEPTTLHWHGMHLPARMDGGPHQLVEPGATWEPRWTIDQPAATLWYHPHPHGETEDHVYRGVAGMFILDDAASQALQLPKDYGVDDVPIIVQDKRFDSSGQFSDGGSFLSPTGRLGDELLVNGTWSPFLDVTTERIRLRLLNGSTARVYNFGFSDDRAFALVGTDGGLLPAPTITRRVQLSPGERAEIVVDVRPGERTVLRSFEPELGDALSERFAGGDDVLDVLELRAAASLRLSPALPAKLAEVPRLDPAEAAETRTFVLSGRNINGRKMDPSRIDATVRTGTSEVWNVVNRDGSPHNFHVHDVQFQVLDVDGAAPAPELRGWKDTIFMPPGRNVGLIARFDDFADPSTPYMFHCHLLRHEDQGMMGQFVVVEPGESGQPSRSHGQHRH